MSMLPVGSTIGILGDGQLGRMLASAAARLGFDVVVFGPNEDSPASRVAKHTLVADYTDKDALAEFHVRTNVITLEFENVPVESIQILEDMGATVRPGKKSLEICQDRHLEKQFARDNGIPTAPYWVINSVEDLAAALKELDGKGILKTRRDGYDGHGQARVSKDDNPATAYARIGNQPAVLEAFVPFVGETSGIVARQADGTYTTFEPARNVHKDGILYSSTVPSGFDDETIADTIEYTIRLSKALDHVGVMAAEFFVLENGDIVLNEMAPRVHNSGHWTPEACQVGQFEQHIRAITGWPLIRPRRTVDVEMINLLGDDIFDTFGPDDLVTIYGKREARAGRKMGHVVRRLNLG